MVWSEEESLTAWLLRIYTKMGRQERNLTSEFQGKSKMKFKRIWDLITLVLHTV